MPSIKFNRADFHFEQLEEFQFNPQDGLIDKKYLTPKMVGIFECNGTIAFNVAAFKKAGLLFQWAELVEEYGSNKHFFHNLCNVVYAKQVAVFDELAECLAKKYPNGYRLRSNLIKVDVLDSNREALFEAFLMFIRQFLMDEFPDPEFNGDRDFQSFDYKEEHEIILLKLRHEGTVVVEIEDLDPPKPDMVEVLDNLFNAYPNGFTLTYGKKTIPCYKPDNVTNYALLGWLENILTELHGPYKTIEIILDQYIVLDGDHFVCPKEI
jgi:hypothetical protein